jgi:hypothetical protein
VRFNGLILTISPGDSVQALRSAAATAPGYDVIGAPEDPDGQ